MDVIYTFSSPVGQICLSSNEKSLTGLWLEGQKHFAATLSGQEQHKNLPIFDAVQQWLKLYFAGKRPSFSPPLEPSGSKFQQEVWKHLMEIPYGETTTYGKIAASLQERGISTSPRSVGGAVGRNPISILIPCHRVVGANGSLTGYAGGIAVKQKLLELEGVDLSQFSFSKPF